MNNGTTRTGSRGCARWMGWIRSDLARDGPAAGGGWSAVLSVWLAAGVSSGWNRSRQKPCSGLDRGPTMATPMAFSVPPRADRAPGETSDSIAWIGDGGALCVTSLLGGVAFGVLHRPWDQWLWGCARFVGVFCGCDDDVEKSLGCGDGLGSRSFRHVRQLSPVGVASSLAS